MNKAKELIQEIEKENSYYQSHAGIAFIKLVSEVLDYREYEIIKNWIDRYKAMDGKERSKVFDYYSNRLK